METCYSYISIFRTFYRIWSASCKMFQFKVVAMNSFFCKPLNGLQLSYNSNLSGLSCPVRIFHVTLTTAFRTIPTIWRLFVLKMACSVACVQSQTPKEVGTAQLRTKACYARSARFPDFLENNLCKKINTLNMLPLE
jgi:hypothetical protein